MKTSEIQRYGSTRPADGLPLISRAVVHGGILHLCGVTAEPVGDVQVQTRRVLQRIDGLLHAHGSDKSRLLTAQVWLADMALFEAHNAVWNEWVDPLAAPVRACVGAALWREGLLVEIMVTAAAATAEAVA